MNTKYELDVYQYYYTINGIKYVLVCKPDYKFKKEINREHYDKEIRYYLGIASKHPLHAQIVQLYEENGGVGS